MQDYNKAVRTVWRVTLILAVVTIIEVVGVLVYPKEEAPMLPLQLFVITLTLLKAFYIVAEFMHLKYEWKTFILTILLPCLGFLWFILAFLWDGTHWLNQRGMELYECLPGLFG